ncbi:MAG: hypothetical protein ACPG31_06215 [Planctomycetota bacterium]
MFRSIVASAAVMALAAGASAQVQQKAGSLNTKVAPSTGTYNLTTGFESTSQQAYRSGPETIFSNKAGAEYYYSGQADSIEWVDEMAFAADDIDGTEQINGMAWEYCSTAPDLSLLGVVDLEIRFYNDTVLGAGPTGWHDPIGMTSQNAACAYGLADLPGDQTGGGIGCWIIDLDLEAGFECSLPQELTPGGMTELNGVGWMYSDGIDGSGPVLDSIFAATSVGYGSQDYFEEFDLSLGLGAEYVGAFFFGGAPKAQGSFDLELYGNGILDTESLNAATPDTGDVLYLTSDVEFRTGNAVTWSLAATTAGTTYAMVVGTAGDAAGFGLVAPGSTLMVNPATVLTPPTPLVMTAGSVTTPTLPGLPPTVYAQAFGFVGGIAPGTVTEASNALVMNN